MQVEESYNTRATGFGEQALKDFVFDNVKIKFIKILDIEFLGRKLILRTFTLITHFNMLAQFLSYVVLRDEIIEGMLDNIKTRL